jgi:hypothetical protein
MMMDAAKDGQSAEANRLYWETQTPVAEIAARLDISRRALYGLIEPWPAERPCAVCSGPLGYANRSARSGGSAACALCGRSEEEAAEEAAADTTIEDAIAAEAAGTPRSARSGRAGNAHNSNDISGDLHDLDLSDYVRVEAEAVARYRAARRRATLGRAARIGAAAAAGAMIGAVATILVTRRD